VELLGVEARDGRARKQEPKEIGAGFGDLVERQRGPLQFREDGELPGSSRRFQYEIGRCDAGGETGDEAELDGR
jgi:hypothetical protein